jgi:hypothetical protein
VEHVNLSRRLVYTPYHNFPTTKILYKTIILGKTPFTVAKETVYEVSASHLSNIKTQTFNTFTYILFNAPFNVAELLKKTEIFNGNFAGPLIKTVSNTWNNLQVPPMFTLPAPVLEIVKMHSSKAAVFIAIAIFAMSIRALF